MAVDLKPETERLLSEELGKGYFRTIDEIIVEGVQALREFQALADLDGEDPETINEIEAGLREIENGAGISWKDARSHLTEKYGL